MSVQRRLPSLRTGRGSHPSAYMHPGEILWLHGTRFLVRANASITIQFEDNGWTILPMSAHLCKVLPVPLAWVADAGRRELVWCPLVGQPGPIVTDRTGQPWRSVLAALAEAQREASE